MPNNPRYCFRVLGSRNAKRRPVDATAAWSAYASCNPQCELEKESFLSLWYCEDFRRHLSECGTPKQFNGICWSPWLWFDIDRGDLQQAHVDTLKLCRWLGEEVATELYFTGSKGFNVGIPTPHSLEPSVFFNDVLEAAALRIAKKSKCGEIDPAVYVKVQPFRAPNSRHPKSGLYKRRLSWQEITTLTIDQIKELAKSPVPFVWELPRHPLPGVLCELWVDAENEVLAARRQKSRSKPPGCPQIKSNIKPHHTQPPQEAGAQRLNQSTMDFIREGCEPGERHRRLYSAAANISEFGCSHEFTYALLSEIAFDCGLSPKDTRRAIENGWRKGGGE